MTNPDTLSHPIRWGIIGVGDVTEVKSGPAFQKTEGFEIASVMRRNADKVADYAKRHGIRKYTTDAEALINDPEVDAVYIATPPDSHLYYGLLVAAAGKPCCIEKPLAQNYADSLAIHEAFQQRGIPLFVAYYRRSLPRFNQVKTWLEEGRIGTVRHVNRRLSKPAGAMDLSGQYNWRTDPQVAPGGYFDDLACHTLDLLIHLLGPIREAHGISLNQQGLYGAKDAVTGCWLHKNGVTGAGNWNFGSYKNEDRVEIFGNQGQIEFSVFVDAPLILENEQGRQEAVIDNPENIQLHHVENMRDHLLGKKIHPATGLTAVHTSWVLDRISGGGLDNIQGD